MQGMLRESVGLFALETLTLNHIICRVPLESLISSKNADLTANATERIALMLKLIQLRTLESSKWSRYINSLPVSFTTPVALVDNNQIYSSIIQLLPLNESVTSKIKTLKSEFEAFGSSSYDDWLWADQVFWSRVLSVPAFSLDPESPHSSEALCMIPFLDFANHSFHPNCRWEVDVTSKSILLITTCPVKSNSELTISYGDKPNSELLFIHGFSVPNNPHDTIAIPLRKTMEFVPEELQQAKWDLLTDILHSPRVLQLPWPLHPPTTLKSLLPVPILASLLVLSVSFEEGFNVIQDPAADTNTFVIGDIPIMCFADVAAVYDSHAALQPVWDLRMVTILMTILAKYSAMTQFAQLEMQKYDGTTSQAPLAPLAVYVDSQMKFFEEWIAVLTGIQTTLMADSRVQAFLSK